MNTDDLRYRAFKDLGSILSFFEINNSEDESVSDVAKALGMHPSKVSRMLRSLEVQGLFERNPDTGRYRIGSRFLEIGLLYALNHPLRRLIFPHVEQMAKELNLLAGWGLFRNDKVVIVDRLRIGDDLPMHILGTDLPLYSTAYGKLFLAYLDDAERERIFTSIAFVKFTPHTVTDRDVLEKELAQVRTEGYALDDEGTRERLRGLAAPVFDTYGTVAAAITTAGRATHLTDKRLPEVTKYLVDKANFISRQLGYEGRVIARPQKAHTRGRPSLKGL
jgi:IclR family transcriptional regulator, KDG regulon repressor